MCNDHSCQRDACALAEDDADNSEGWDDGEDDDSELGREIHHEPAADERLRYVPPPVAQIVSQGLANQRRVYSTWA